MSELNTNENLNVQTEDVKSTEQQNKENNQQQTPTIEELTLQLAKANAEKAKFKNSIDKLTHENSELTKWKRERMTAQEQQDEADAEAKQRQEEYIKELEQYKAVNETMKRYLGMGMNAELSLSTAQAEVSGDMETVMKNVAKHQEDLMTAAKAEWLKSRPDIADGASESSVTKEQFEKMTMFERTKLLRTDPDTYHRLVGR